MSDHTALMLESAKLHEATVALFATLPESYRTSHLSLRARDLAKRLRAAAPPQTETKDTDG